MFIQSKFPSQEVMTLMIQIDVWKKIELKYLCGSSRHENHLMEDKSASCMRFQER